MSTVREFFAAEAAECLAGLEAALAAANEATIDAYVLLRHCRTLRGSAQLAREEHVALVARTLEAVARALVSRVIAWDPDLKSRATATLADLQALIGGGLSGGDAEAVAVAAVKRWATSPVRIPGLPEPPRRAPTTPAPSAEGGAPSAEFLDFAAREVAAILAEVEAALPVLQSAPTDREPLKKILRRQRALYGAAALRTMPAVAEALTALDSICRLIARHDAPVTGDWFAFFTVAREVLAEAAALLTLGINPATVKDLQHLRSSRDALTERYGAAAPPPPPPAVPEDAPVEVLNYFRGEAGALLDRIERMARELTTAPPQRSQELRTELGVALTALRDTAATFGFADVARAVDAGLGGIWASPAFEVLGRVAELRAIVAANAAGNDAGHDPEAEPVVDIETLCYRGEAALRRALELRPAIERAVRGDPTATAVVDELFDLIRLGLS